MREPLERLEGESDELFEQRQGEANAAYLAELRKRIRPPDPAGNLVVDLFDPVPMGTEGAHRATVMVRPVKVKDARETRLEERLLEELAERLVEPAGVFDELRSDDDAAAVLLAVGDQWGKYHARRSGRSTS